jgi:flagellar assembly factor FliW
MLRVVPGSSSEIVTVHSPVLGRLDIGADQVLHFVEPIAGFPGCTRYALLPYALAGRIDPAMGWLQAMDAPLHTFLVTDPWSAVSEYQPEIADGDIAAVSAQALTDASLLAILTVSRVDRALTANLQAPLLVNLAGGLAKQVLLLNSESYTTRQRVCDLP